jgi:hypothetical protein
MMILPGIGVYKTVLGRDGKMYDPYDPEEERRLNRDERPETIHS